jgi:hypothetical protein
MKNVYEVLRQKELEVSRLKKEVEALRVAAPLLAEAGEAEYDDESPLSGSTAPLTVDSWPQAANDTPQPARATAWGDRAKKHWP